MTERFREQAYCSNYKSCEPVWYSGYSVRLRVRRARFESLLCPGGLLGDLGPVVIFQPNLPYKVAKAGKKCCDLFWIYPGEKNERKLLK